MINNINFGARMFFQLPQKDIPTEVKINAHKIKSTKTSAPIKTSEPSELMKYVLGIKKGTKLPTRKVNNNIDKWSKQQ